MVDAQPKKFLDCFETSSLAGTNSVTATVELVIEWVTNALHVLLD